MTCTIRAQTIMLTDNMRVEFSEERHGEFTISVLAITKDALTHRLRFDPRGDLVMATTSPAPLPTSADPFKKEETGSAHAANG